MEVEDLQEIKDREKEHIENMRDENLRLKEDIMSKPPKPAEEQPVVTTPEKKTPAKRGLFSPAKSPVTMHLVLTPMKQGNASSKKEIPDRKSVV